MKGTRVHSVALAAMMLASFAACEEEAPPPPPPRAKKQETIASRGDAASQPAEKYVYSPIGKRDPFRPFYVDQALDEEEKSSKRTLTELEKFEIDQLKLVGIVTGTSTPSAMFEDPDGRGWVVMIGTLVGRHGGRVSKIQRDEVIIVEEFRDPATNKKVASPVSVRLPSEELLVDK